MPAHSAYPHDTETEPQSRRKFLWLSGGGLGGLAGHIYIAFRDYSVKPNLKQISSTIYYSTHIYTLPQGRYI